MAKTIEQLKAQGAEVKNATVVGENTATRVGTLFNDIVEHVEDYEEKQAERDTQQDNTAASLVSAEAEARDIAINKEAQTRATNDENLNKAIVFEVARAKAAEEANATSIIGTDRIADGAVTIEKLADSAIDDEPTAGSDNLIKSGGVVERMVKNDNISQNLVNPQSCLYGAVISYDGKIRTEFPVDEYCVSSYIPVNGSNIIANSYQSENWGSFNVYDASKRLLRVIQNNAQYTYSNGDAYIRICFRWINNIVNIMANYGTLLLPFELYNPIGGYIEKPLIRIETTFDSKCDNLFTVNLVDRSKCLSAKIIREIGTDFSDFTDAHYWATDYIPVIGRNISANSFQEGAFGSFVVYDKDKNPLAVIRNSALYEYQEYRGDCYVRISIHSPNDNIVDFRANYGDILQPYAEYKTIIDKINDNLSSIDKLKIEKYVDASVQPVIGFDNLTEWFGVVFTSWPLVRDFDGGFYMKEILYKTTEATLELHNLSIVNGVLTDNGIAETITLDSSWLDPSLGQNVYRIPFKKTIQYIPAPKGFFADGKTLDDIGYISAGTTIANLPENDEKHAIAFGIVARGFTTEYDKLSNKITELKENILENKKIGFLGDSITAMGYYISALQQMSNCVAVNYGIGGSHIAARSADDIEAFEKRVPALASDLDGVVVFGGTNDFGHTITAPFGTFYDYTDKNIFSFYAGCHRTFKQLYDKYRGKPIVVMLPLHHGYEVDNPEYIFNADGTITSGTNPTTRKTFKEYVDAIKQVAQYYSFYVIDAYSESGLNPCLETSDARYYFTDGLHLNQVGGNRLANFMLPLMEQVFSMFKNIASN